jgi:translation initiation factor 2 beta subunit (eIF-2beta)/eIF-5
VLSNLVDWKAFEMFVKNLYDADGTISVERDVTLIGKSGARRQADVRLTLKTVLHTYVTIVECKRWKDPVSRDRIDVLAATVEDLGASKGVMFTTSGYEEGAKQYAEHKGLDLFLVRDLTDEEWGLPGRYG